MYIYISPNFNKRNHGWLNNANPWIMNVCCCNHDLKCIATHGKDNKVLIYYKQITLPKHQIIHHICIH